MVITIKPLPHTHHDPASPEEDENSEDVEHARGKDAIPRAEEHRPLEVEVVTPPRALAWE